MLVGVEEAFSGEYDSIYLSPHLDDAALSCGGRISAQRRAGERVLVITVFSGGEHGTGGSGGVFAAFEDMAARRREDEQAMDVLGADHAWLGYEEAIGRLPKYRSPVGLIEKVSNADRPLIDELASLADRLCTGCFTLKGVEEIDDLSEGRSKMPWRRTLHFSLYPFESLFQKIL